MNANSARRVGVRLHAEYPGAAMHITEMLCKSAGGSAGIDIGGKIDIFI